LDYALLEQRPGRTLRASSNREIGVPKFLCIAGTCAALAITVVPAANARAAEIGGVTLPPTITYSDKQLALAGCGTREISVFFVGIDLYVISLYLPTPTTDVATILAPGTAKLVRLNVVYDGSMPDSLPDEWRTRIEDAVSAEMLRTLQGFYKRIRSGDVVTVGYAPDSDTTLRINGEAVVSQSGNDLIDTMLRIWIGDSPISDNLKRLLLKGSCP
jgi:hypothetical protein